MTNEEKLNIKKLEDLKNADCELIAQSMQRISGMKKFSEKDTEENKYCDSADYSGLARCEQQCNACKNR